jgi:uncharacterized protein
MDRQRCRARLVSAGREEAALTVHPRAAELIATLDLKPHPEGGFYREILRSALRVQPDDERGERAALTSIYFLLPGGAVSRWHRVSSDEVWHLYEGGPLELLEMDAHFHGVERHILAAVAPDRRPVHAIASNRWQAARALGDYALVGCTVGPGFEFADFHLLDESEGTAVSRKWPELSPFV